MKDTRSKKTRMLLVFAGGISFILGSLGVVIPLLPTTPFILLAGYCFARGSRKAHKWIMANRWSGNIIKNWRKKKKVRRSIKIKTLVFTILSFVYSFYIINIWYLQLFLVFVFLIVISSILRLPVFDS